VKLHECPACEVEALDFTPSQAFLLGHCCQREYPGKTEGRLCARHHEESITIEAGRVLDGPASRYDDLPS
jgi:hypothetical protein